MNSAAVCPNSRCSSVRSSRMKTSSAAATDASGTVRRRSRVCVWVMAVSAFAARRSRVRERARRLTALQRVGSISLTTCQPSTNCSICRAASRSSPAARAASAEEMAEGLAEAGASLMLCARRDEWLTPTVDAMRARGFTVEGVLCDVSKAGRRAGGRRQDDRRVRPGRHPGQQRRRHLGRPSPKTMPLEQVAEGRRHQPDRRVSVLAGGRPRDAEAAVRAASSTSRRSPACTRRCNGPHYAAYAATKAGLMGLTRELAGVVGRARASASTRSRPASSTRGWPTARSR